MFLSFWESCFGCYLLVLPVFFMIPTWQGRKFQLHWRPLVFSNANPSQAIVCTITVDLSDLVRATQMLQFHNTVKANLKSLLMFLLTDRDRKIFQPPLCKWVCGLNKEVEVLVFQTCRDLTASCCWAESLAVVLEGVSPPKVVGGLWSKACCSTAPCVEMPLFFRGSI